MAPYIFRDTHMTIKASVLLESLQRWKQLSLLPVMTVTGKKLYH